MLPTLQLKNGRLPILTGSVQVTSVMFTSGLCASKYGCLVFMACLEVESWYLFFQDKTKEGNSIGEDEKCIRQAIEIHDRTVSRCAEPQSGYRVVEG